MFAIISRSLVSSMCVIKRTEIYMCSQILMMCVCVCVCVNGESFMSCNVANEIISCADVQCSERFPLILFDKINLIGSVC